MKLIIARMDIRRHALLISRHEFFSILGRIVLSERDFIPHSERRLEEKEQNLHNGVGDSR